MTANWADFSKENVFDPDKFWLLWRDDTEQCYDVETAEWVSDLFEGTFFDEFEMGDFNLDEEHFQDAYFLSCSEFDEFLPEPSHEHVSYIRQAQVAALLRIEDVKARHEALDFAVRGIRESHFVRTEREFDNAVSLIRGLLYQEETRAYRDAMMFSDLLGDPDVRKKLREETVKRFLSEKFSKAPFLETSTFVPYGYTRLDDSVFDAELKDAMECDHESPERCDDAHRLSVQNAALLKKFKELEDKHQALIQEFADFDRNRDKNRK